MSQINDLSFHLKKLANKSQSKQNWKQLKWPSTDELINCGISMQYNTTQQ